jgi:competence protein ComEC
VIRVRYGAVDVWLTGDAGAEFEQSMVVADEGPRLRILKVGHHGSRTSSGARLVDSLRPAIALISAGRGNLFGHPSRDVIARLEGVGASVFRTDQDGAIVVETDGASARARTASGRSYFVSMSGVPPARRP